MPGSSEMSEWSPIDADCKGDGCASSRTNWLSETIIIPKAQFPTTPALNSLPLHVEEGGVLYGQSKNSSRNSITILPQNPPDRDSGSCFCSPASWAIIPDHPEEARYQMAHPRRQPSLLPPVLCPAYANQIAQFVASLFRLIGAL